MAGDTKGTRGRSLSVVEEIARTAVATDDKELFRIASLLAGGAQADAIGGSAKSVGMALIALGRVDEAVDFLACRLGSSRVDGAIGDDEGAEVDEDENLPVQPEGPVSVLRPADQGEGVYEDSDESGRGKVTSTLSVKTAKTQSAPAIKKLADKKAATKRAPDKKAPAKKAPDKKAPDKKAPAKKAPDKKAPDKKAPDKKAPAKKAPAKKAPAKKAPAKKAPAKKAPAKKAPAKKAPAKKAPAKKAPAKKAPAKKAPAKKAPAKKMETARTRQSRGKGSK